MSAELFRFGLCPNCGETVTKVSAAGRAQNGGEMRQAGECEACGTVLTRLVSDTSEWEMTDEERSRVTREQLDLAAAAKGHEVRINFLQLESWEGFLVYGEPYPQDLKGTATSGVVHGKSEQEVVEKLLTLVEAAPGLGG